MLTPAELELLTLSIDGESTPSEEVRVRELLAESLEALRLYQTLQQQKRSISRLPKQVAPESVFAAVMRQLPAEQAQPRRVGKRSLNYWLPYVTAACILVAVCASTFLLTLNSDSQSEQMAMKQLPRTKATSVGQPDRSVALAQDRTTFSEVAPEPRAAQPQIASAKKATFEPEIAPAPRSNNPDLVASPPLPESTGLTDVQLRLPWLADFSELQKADGRARLSQELGKGTAFRLDLHSRDTNRALDSFLTAAKSANLKLSIDSSAQDRHGKKLPTQYAIFSDSFTAQEWAKLLGSLAAQPAPVSSEQAIASLHLIPASTTDSTDLRTLLGSDLGLLKRSNATSKPVSSGTIDQLSTALRGQSPDEKQGVLVTFGPNAFRVPPQQSKAIRTYLEHKVERKPTALPILVVIR
jgi:hypothetical protein